MAWPETQFTRWVALASRPSVVPARLPRMQPKARETRPTRDHTAPCRTNERRRRWQQGGDLCLHRTTERRRRCFRLRGPTLRLARYPRTALPRVRLRRCAPTHHLRPQLQPQLQPQLGQRLRQRALRPRTARESENHSRRHRVARLPPRDLQAPRRSQALPWKPRTSPPASPPTFGASSTSAETRSRGRTLPAPGPATAAAARCPPRCAPPPSSLTRCRAHRARRAKPTR